ncbi:filamentous hemagglutinin N-terminal domain-containing protein [Candidatus Albibeggiatoa sp. nov. NOAA]|uniref:two-partner secretion domain-containing protein n=1 Tax=Candidatus Albibeggiatoa sp. nov. NOAA TaxID=3162724 RepID=UPI0032F321D1|nr:filamentous hemagglutinin N-terminal domain-containing protein [Thiotrichaceae bacterium]
MRAIVWMSVCMIISNAAQAEISVNQLSVNSYQLPAIDGVYNIPQALGQMVGSNLFHTFDSFNVNQGEIAQFSGSDSIQNIISRVIGSESSFINGTIRSTIPNADFYLLNPNGLVFGEHAKLDLQGSFHTSTADYIKLSDGGEFHTRFPAQDILTTASIQAFGFLTDTPTAIDFQGSRLVVQPEKDINVIAGDINMDKARLFATNEKTVKAGSIWIASVASQGEVGLLESDLDVSSFDNLGNIKMIGVGTNIGDGVLSVKGTESGLILIRGGNMLLSDRGFLEANNYAKQANVGKGIDIKLTGTLQLTKAAEIVSKTFSPVQTAPISIEVDKLELRDGSQISSNVWDAGHGNQISIKANEILLSGIGEQTITATNGVAARNASGIASTSHTINPNAIESSIHIETPKLIVEDQAQINVASLGLGKAGSIYLDVDQLSLTTGGSVISTAIGLGDGGLIQINANQIHVSESANISSSGFGQGTGKAGDILITSNQFELISGGNVNISTLGLGQSGRIKINVANTLRLSGGSRPEHLRYYNFVNEQLAGSLPLLGVKPSDVIGASKINASVINLGAASAGNIEIQAGRIDVFDGAEITGEHRGLGHAGQISIQANDIHLSHGKITTETFGGGGGGNIQFTVNNILYLTQSDITTSVGKGLGQGGEVSINNPAFTVLNHSQIIAQADEGQGGNIQIVADQFLKSPSSLVSASSRLGIDGNIEITSPDETISSGLLTLNKNFSELAQIKDACKTAIAGQLPTEFQPPLTFKINMYRFSNDFVEDWIPSAASRLRLSDCK